MFFPNLLPPLLLLTVYAFFLSSSIFFVVSFFLFLIAVFPNSIIMDKKYVELQVFMSPAGRIKIEKKR